MIITGKGHEPTQEIAGVFHRYNDRDVLLAAVGATGTSPRTSVPTPARADAQPSGGAAE